MTVSVSGPDGGNGNGNGHGNGHGRLDSWKAIAAYLGRDVGTVRRWERTRGLPVHRVPGGKGSSVFAYAHEIDVWLKSPQQASALDESPEPEAIGDDRSTAWWRWVAVSVGMAGVLALGWRMQQTRASTVDMQVQFSEQAITASTADGRELWTHPLGDDFRHLKTEVSDYTRIVRGRNPRVYYLTSHRERRTDKTADGGEFGALDTQGRPIFSFRFDDVLRFGETDYRAPWALTAFSVLDGDPPERHAVAAHHWLWGASMLAVLDGQGRRIGTFANDGWIEQLHWLSPDRLVFGGFSHAKDGGMVGVLDPRMLDGQSPEPPGSPNHCGTCGSQAPLAMAVMPRSEINRLTQSRFNRAVVERTPDRIIVRTIEIPPVPDNQGAVDVIYEFTTGLDLVRASYGERYWEMHDRLFAERKVDHDRASCPYREPPPIHSWSPATGWQLVLPGKPRA